MYLRVGGMLYEEKFICPVAHHPLPLPLSFPNADKDFIKKGVETRLDDPLATGKQKDVLFPTWCQFLPRYCGKIKS